MTRLFVTAKTVASSSASSSMLITKLRSKESREFLARVGFGLLGCSSNSRPYIVPVYFVYDRERLYCFSTAGQKIQWMRENPLVCVEADEIKDHDHWTTVVVLGKYVEIPNDEDNRKGWEYARALFQKRKLWWQSGYTAAQIRRSATLPEPVFYCIVIEQLTGLRGSPDFAESSKRRPAAPAKS